MRFTAPNTESAYRGTIEAHNQAMRLYSENLIDKDGVLFEYEQTETGD